MCCSLPDWVFEGMLGLEPALQQFVLTTSGLFRCLQSDYCASFQWHFSKWIKCDSNQNDLIFCLENKYISIMSEVTSVGPTLLELLPLSLWSCAQTLAILLQFFSACWVVSVWTDWEESGPEARWAEEKNGSDEEMGKRARCSASAVGNDLTVQVFSPASTSNTPDGTREVVSPRKSGKRSGRPQESEMITKSWIDVSRRV